MFHSSTSSSMDLGCPLLRGSSVRRLRRRAATVAIQNNFRKEMMTSLEAGRVPSSFKMMTCDPYSSHSPKSLVTLKTTGEKSSATLSSIISSPSPK